MVHIIRLTQRFPVDQPVSVGTDDTDSVFLSSTWSGAFVNGSLAGQGLKEDSGWTPYGTVALQVTANAPTIVASVNGGGHLLNGEGKKKDLLDVSFGGSVDKWSDNTLTGDFQVNLHNVGIDGLDKSKFHGTDVTAINFFDGDNLTCNDAVNFTVNGTFDGQSGYSMIFRAGDLGSPNTADTIRVSIFYGLNGNGTPVYDTHTSDFTDESHCVGTARTGLDNGNITITR